MSDGKAPVASARDARALLAISPDIRYVATYLQGVLETVQRPDLVHASSSESDRYEELLVNPALLTLVTQRGNIDCGGARCVLARYGNFTQLVVPAAQGHVSVAIGDGADWLRIAERVLARLRPGEDPRATCIWTV